MNNERLGRINELVEEAERRLSWITEVSGEGIDPSALNELRYAFVHVLRGLLNEKPEELERAERHVCRSIYDCYEIEVYYSLNIFREFSEHWRATPVVISEIEPEWANWCLAMSALRDFRETVQRDNRDEYVKALDQHLVKVRKIVPKLEFLEEDLKKKLLSQTKTIFWTRASAIGAFIAVIATGVVYGLQRSDSESAAAQPNLPTVNSVDKSGVPAQR